MHSLIQQVKTASDQNSCCSEDFEIPDRMLLLFIFLWHCLFLQYYKNSSSEIFRSRYLFLDIDRCLYLMEVHKWPILYEPSFLTKSIMWRGLLPWRTVTKGTNLCFTYSPYNSLHVAVTCALLPLGYNHSKTQKRKTGRMFLAQKSPWSSPFTDDVKADG